MPKKQSVIKSDDMAAAKAVRTSLGMKLKVISSTRKKTPASGAENAALNPAAIPHPWSLLRSSGSAWKRFSPKA